MLASVLGGLLALVVAPPATGADDGGGWIRRHAPRRGELDLGLYGGGHWSSPVHLLVDDDRLDRHYRLRPSPQLGLQIGWHPLRFLGLEVEAGGGPVRVRTPEADDLGALVHTRGHAVLQFPRWNVVPFVLFGGGVLALASPSSSLGRDVDGVVHFGVGVKLNVLRRLGLRLEYRHTIGRRCSAVDGSGPDRGCVVPVGRGPFEGHHPQLMFSLALRLRG